MSTLNPEDNGPELSGWHFIAGAICPRCKSADTLKFHFSGLQLACVECGLEADESTIEAMGQDPQAYDPNIIKLYNPENE